MLAALSTHLVGRIHVDLGRMRSAICCPSMFWQPPCPGQRRPPDHPRSPLGAHRAERIEPTTLRSRRLRTHLSRGL